MVDNISPVATHTALKENPRAQLVDVRTDAEWTFVGLPDLADAGKQPKLIPWQVYPSMQVNSDFVIRMRELGLTPDDHVFFLCRSGVRSLAAAAAAREAGFPNVFNIADGFEGTPDGEGHRGTVAGWKAEGLPWRQR